MGTKALLQNVTTVGVSPWAPVTPGSLRHTFQVIISGAASVNLEGSNDGVNAVTLQSGIAASGGYTDNAPWQYYRANVTSISSGTVTVVMGE
jgi:hypothetical protein